MHIEIKDEDFTLVISNEELNNDNYIDLEFLSDLAKDKDNPRGFMGEGTVPIDELKSAVDAFIQLRDDRLERDKLMK